MPSIYDDEVRDREGWATSGAPSSTGIPSGTSKYDPEADADATSGGKHIPSADQGLIGQLRKKEAQPSGLPSGLGMAGVGVSGIGGAATALKTIGSFLWGNNKRKTATLAGTGTGFVVLAIIWIINISTGPFTLIHIGQILAKHFEPGTHQAEKRLGRMMYEMLSSPPEDVKNPIGDNRLSTLGYLMKNRTLARLRAKGIKPLLKSDGFSFDGFEIDPNADNSPYKDLFNKYGYDDARVMDTIKTAMDPNGKLKLDFKVSEGKIIVQGDQTLFSDTGIKAMSDLLVSGNHPFFDPIFDFIRVRNLSRWTISGNLHFISKLDAKITSAKDAWLKKYIYDPIKNGLNGDTSDGVAVEGKDANGNPTETPLEGGEGPVSESAIKGFLTDPKSFATATGVIAAAAAIICIMQAVNKSVGIIRYVQIFLPLMRWSSVTMSASSQLQSGQDGENSQYKAISDATLTSYDKGGNATSTWYDAASIRSTAGDSGGIDMNQSIKDMMHGSGIPWLAWTNSDAVKALCSTAAQVTLGIVSVGLLLIPGVDVISAAIGVVAFGAISEATVNLLPSILAGQGINVQASGAEWGNDIDYGSRLVSNEKNLQEGGVALTQQEENQQVAEASATDRQQFHDESLADRIFNASDYRSVVGSMLDHAGVYNAQGLVAKVGSIPNILGSLFSLPGSIVSATAHAASPYQYPFPMVGFSDTDINSTIVNQPFANADKVSVILDNEAQSGDHTYIDRALNCFGVSITKGDQGWDAVPTTTKGTDDQNHAYGVNPYDETHYNQSDCADAGNADWLRVRMWIFDVANMEGYACSQGDATSCENSGFTTVSNSTPIANGVKFFSQNDPRWINTTMWNGSTIGSEGCVLASEAMAISTLTGKDVTPVELDQKYGSDNDPYGNYGLHYTGLWSGEQLEATPQNLQRVVSAVRSGAVVVVYAFWDNVEPFWGTSGHAEVIRGIAPDGNLLVYDPWDLPSSINPYVPDPKFPNDAAQHGAKEWPQSNFLNDTIKINSRHSNLADMRFDIITK